MAEPTNWMRQALHEEPIERTPIDTSKPSIARVYDYVLGGKDNYAVDRDAAASMLDVVPDTPLMARDNRAFLRRAVRYLVAEAGITQIIDIGSGLPTAGNVHEIAHEIDPNVAVVYVDNDPIVLAHGRALLADNETTTVITAELRDPRSIFDHPDTRKHIDMARPFAVLTASILQHLSDAEDPEGIATNIRGRLPSGSYLLSANFHDSDGPRVRELERAFLEGGLGTGRFRTWEEQRRYFDGLEMVEPGLVAANEWRPDADTPTDSSVHDLYIGGIGRKP